MVKMVEVLARGTERVVHRAQERKARVGGSILEMGVIRRGREREERLRQEAYKKVISVAQLIPQSMKFYCIGGIRRES